jgi:sulfonate transport system permease protein
MLVGVLIIGLTGLALDFIFRYLEKRLLPCQEKADPPEVPTWQIS